MVHVVNRARVKAVKRIKPAIGRNQPLAAKPAVPLSNVMCRVIAAAQLLREKRNIERDAIDSSRMKRASVKTKAPGVNARHESGPRRTKSKISMDLFDIFPIVN